MMLISGLLLVICACIAGALLWSLAVHALPLWCGGLAALSVYKAGGGLFACVLAGFAAATATIITGQLLGGIIHSPLLRAFARLAFAVPAAIAGFHAAQGIAAALGIDGGTKVMSAISMSVLSALAAWRGAFRSRV